MGKGGYTGGSTIVGGFGWSSFDPASASAGKIVKRRKGKANRPSAQQAKNNPPSAPHKKKENKAKRPLNLNPLRLIYLEAIIDAALRAQPAPVAPKRVREQMNAATLSAGGPVEWAKAQPEYSATLDRRQRKLANKAQAQVEGGRKVVVLERRASTAVAHANGAQRPPVLQLNRASIETLCRERARLSTTLAAAEADIRRHKEAIAEIDRRLATANSKRG